jgi:hypothetical protein
MKRIIITVVFGLFSMVGFSQETNAYTFFVNVVNDDFKFPLIGFVNMAKGDHKGVQLGFVNWNMRNFSGLQMGFVNTLGGSLTGAQLAYINTAVQQVNGIQIGFVNTASQEVNGAQYGFLNTSLKTIYGSQIGFLNTAKQEVQGAQVGFVNTAIQSVSGAQVGFVNTAFQSAREAQVGFVNTTMKESRGAQVGFVNFANRKENGLQLGFINYTDTLEKGIPIGFLSFVRRGGYMALEYSFSEFFPVTVGFKTGVEKFYTTLFIAYNPFSESTKNTYASGAGIGSIIPLKKSFFFNPELHTMNTIEKKNNRQLTIFVPYFGYHFSNHFSMTAGPSVVWSANFEDGVFLKPVFNIANFEIDSKNSIFVGARVGIRYRF